MSTKYVGSRVRIKGGLGTVTRTHTDFKGTVFYMVKMDSVEFGTAEWKYSEDDIKRSLISGYDVTGCECGVVALNERDRSDYSHAQWCAKYKRGHND